MSKQIPPVLIVAFRRSVNLKKIIQICLEAEVPRIYVALDGPRSEFDRPDVDACKATLEEFEIRHPKIFSKKISGINLGSAVSVLTACDWIFSLEDFAIILEDDCIPSLDFFQFTSDGKDFILNDKDIFTICGTQFAPPEVTNSDWSLSKYPLTWGWATSSQKWLTIKDQLLQLRSQNFSFSILQNRDMCYWAAGARRSINGYIDAWDIPIVFTLLRINGLHLLPGVNLVRNIGNDHIATHTSSDSRWIGVSDGVYQFNDTKPNVNMQLDRWLSKNFYQISYKHLISTRITHLLDFIGIYKKVRTPLFLRWF